MRMLLIWEKVPEDTDCYVIEDKEMIALAEQSAGRFINLNENEALNQLSDRLEQFTDNLVDHDKAIIGPFDLVVVCGFIM